MVLTVCQKKKPKILLSEIYSCKDHLHKQQRKISKFLNKRQCLQPVILQVGLHFEDIPG